jgi:hypothetical protein
MFLNNRIPFDDLQLHILLRTMYPLLQANKSFQSLEALSLQFS